MWSRSPVEWGRVLSGRQVTEQSVRCYKANPGDYERWLGYFVKSPTAEQILQSTESASDFFKVESDLGRLIPKEEWNEAFYSLKLGYNVPSIPMQFLYFSIRLFDLYKMCNLLGPLYPKELAFNMDKQGYFGSGYTPLDALKTFVHEDFELVSEEKPIVKCGGWYEAYLPQLDMVCALPTSIGESLTDQDCANVSQKPGVGLVLGEAPLVSLGGMKGVSDSVFDLRGAV